MLLPQELRECADKVDAGIRGVKLVNETNPLHWKGEINGPSGTPYEGGVFCIDINLPKEYPFVPPKVLWHAKVDRLLEAHCRWAVAVAR